MAVGAAGWGPQVRKAAKQMNQQVSDAEVNGILAQIRGSLVVTKVLFKVLLFGM